MANIRDRFDLEPTIEEVRARVPPRGQMGIIEARRCVQREKLLDALYSIELLDAFNPYTPRERALVAILQAMFHGGIV